MTDDRYLLAISDIGERVLTCVDPDVTIDPDVLLAEGDSSLRPKPRIKLGAVEPGSLELGHQDDSRIFETQIYVVAMAAGLSTTAGRPCNVPVPVRGAGSD